MHDCKLGPIGLSKREHFAALILAGLCANSAIELDAYEELAQLAVAQADELIDRLNSLDKTDPESVALDELREEYLRPKD